MSHPVLIELAEYLRCPLDSDESYCVLAAEEVVGRSVVRGTIGCPATRLEYRIEHGIPDFIRDEGVPRPTTTDTHRGDAHTVHALLGLTTPGGYVVLLGSAALMAPDLGELIGGVHFVGLNVPKGVDPSPILSVLRGPYPLPLRSSMARGVVVGSEYSVEPWLSEGGRLLLKGLRIVVLKQGASVSQTDRLASGDGLWVGQKRH